MNKLKRTETREFIWMVAVFLITVIFISVFSLFVFSIYYNLPFNYAIKHVYYNCKLNLIPAEQREAIKTFLPHELDVLSITKETFYIYNISIKDHTYSFLGITSGEGGIYCPLSRSIHNVKTIYQTGLCSHSKEKDNRDALAYAIYVMLEDSATAELFSREGYIENASIEGYHLNAINMMKRFSSNPCISADLYLNDKMEIMQGSIFRLQV